MNKFVKRVSVALCVGILFCGSFSTFATNVESSANNKKVNVNKAKNENQTMVIGKISSIDSTNVVIDVAVRTKRNTKKDGETATQNSERKVPTATEKFTLTGESKTFNIASANLGKKPKENVTKDATTKEEAKKNKAEKMTYADYKVGDYVRITYNNDTPTVAKRLRVANAGVDSTKIGKVKGTYKGSYTGKTKAEKNVE